MVIHINNLFTIGDISKLKNITIETLRHYDRIDLLKPEYVDKKTGYRYYSSKQFFKIDLIRFCKNLDLPLGQIKQLIENSNQESFINFLQSKKNEVNLKIQEYNAMISQIDTITTRIGEYNISKKESGFYLKYLPARNIAYLSCSASSTDEESILAYSNLYNSIVDSNSHITYNGGFIYSIDENIPSAKYIFECVNEVSDSLNVPNKTLPRGTYLCKSYGDEQLNESLEMLLSEIHNRKITSNYIINTYLIDGEFHSNNALSELQIFISDDNLVK